ncbi:hypothetical protein P170DRAFT_480327 [Aspergillus steynii IBT 23096]|uniref:Uncharacterized protein n=1 Tax=Aspergillus steynii IBT 23096 TaxID=1392250 RepID=A0A2I2FVA0_9EURO|nr:uncharacterized protein P170DRAFT_480327 [Aspergillus steynii IBT 23096]PLB44573.1 hypothetical protein P170DRAFT_480327 [Aspergillus steynii IBT 23096]
MRRRSEMCFIRRAIKASIQQTYPLTIGDLTKEHLRLLIEVLKMDNVPLEERTKVPQDEAGIKQAIKKLPWDLRRHAFIRIVPNSLLQPAILCPPHNGLNPYLIGHILRLVKREVTEHLSKLERYTGEMDSECRELLTELQGIRGLWCSDRRYRGYMERMNACYQHNGCETCILAQIIDTPIWLQNLRTTLLSRTRTRAKHRRPHRPPQLLPFIERCIDTHESLYTELFYRSGQMAYAFKAVRKLAVKEYRGKPRYGQSEDEGDPDDNYRNRETIFVYWDRDAERDSNRDAGRESDRDAGWESEAISGPTAVESSSSETAVEDTDGFETLDGRRASRKPTPSEALLEEIIAEYAGLTGTENIEDARLSLLAMQPDVVTPSPLSVAKPTSVTKSATSSPVDVSPTTPYGATGRRTYPSYVAGTPVDVSPTTPYGATERRKPSLSVAGSSKRGSGNWEYSNPRDNVDWRQVIHKPSPLSILRANAETAYHSIQDDAERIALEYRELVSPTAHSESVYSRSPDEDPRRATTWEIVCKDLDIQYPNPQLKKPKKGGLLRKFRK